MSSDPIRTALERLIEAIDGIELEGVSEVDDAIAAARAALAAAPEGEPSGEELTLTYARAVAAAVDGKRGPFNREDAERAQLAGLRAVYARWGRPATPPAGGACGSSIEELGPLISWLCGESARAANAGLSEDAGMLCWAAGIVGERVDEDAPAPAPAVKQSLTTVPPALAEKPGADDVMKLAAIIRRVDGSNRLGAAALAEAILSRYGIPATPPAQGEVGRAVEWMEAQACAYHREDDREYAQRADRAATLLQQLSAPAPAVVAVAVAVAERPWEREGWCDKKRRCWAWSVDLKCWQLLDPRILADWVLLLPAHAIPLPQAGEGE